MKKLLTIALLLGSTIVFAKSEHGHSTEEKKEYYNILKHQVEKGIITLEQAQIRWKNYIYCCK